MDDASRVELLATALLGPDPIIWVWTERFGARPWPGVGSCDADKLGSALQKIEDRAPDGWVSDIIYFLAPIVPGELE
jgi:hypothetical protein